MKQTINNSVELLHEPRRGAHRKCWVVRWWGSPDAATGKQKRYGRSFRHQREAKAFCAEKQAEFSRGAARDPVSVTLAELIKEFEQARLSNLSHASKESYANTTKQLLEYFGARRLVRDIHQRHAEAFLSTRRRCDGRVGELSSWSRARHRINAASLFNAAAAWGYVVENPFRAATGGGASVLGVNPKGRPWHHLTPEEFQGLLAVVQSPTRRADYLLMYAMGLRPGEAANVLVGNIDLEHQRVHVVNRVASNDLPPFTVKAERQTSVSKERSVPIPEAAVADLTEAVRVAFKAGGFVTLTPQRYQVVREHWRLCREGKAWAGHPWRPWLGHRDLSNNRLRDCKNALTRAGIELTAPWTLHTFRKAFSQNLANAGVPPRTLAQLLGHSNSKTTIEFYSRVTDANQLAAAEVMNRLLTEKSSSIKKRKQGS